MSGKKCKHCGSSDIEVDPARGDAVCTNCGSVLEDNIIVAEVEFQENAHGGASAIGQFVSAESKGGASGFGRAFNTGIGQESREVTIRKARDGITALCQQLRLNQQCIDIACNFFKMALSRHLTIGRPAAHTQAACVYMTCRTEGTALMHYKYAVINWGVHTSGYLERFVSTFHRLILGVVDAAPIPGVRLWRIDLGNATLAYRRLP